MEVDYKKLYAEINGKLQDLLGYTTVDFTTGTNFFNLMNFVVRPREGSFIIQRVINSETKQDTISGYLKYLIECLDGTNKDSLLYKHRRLIKTSIQQRY